MNRLRSSLRAAALCAVLPVLAAGCAGTPPVVGDEGWGPAVPELPVEAGTQGSIYRDSGLQLFGDLRARSVGDVLTITLDEQTAASKQSSTNTSKSSDVSTSIPVFGGKAITHNGREIFDNELSGERSFSGAADASQSNQLDGSITVTVAQRLSNGNLVVKGEKWITLNQGREYVRVSGIVRPVDIRPNNTVSSTKVADARIVYSESGALASNNRPGWLSRFFSSAAFPF